MRALDLPPLWLVAFAALALAQGKLLPMPLFGGAGDAAGAVLAAAGLGLMVAAVVRMVRARTTLDPRGEAQVLVTTGVFRLSRNPIYLGDALILAGLILIWDAAPSAPLVLLFIWIIQSRFIGPEEARLRARFGDDFEAYAARTRRWL